MFDVYGFQNSGSLLDHVRYRQNWEMCSNIPYPASQDTHCSSFYYGKQIVFYMASGNNPYMYEPLEDAWIALRAPNFTAGTQDLGSCGTISIGNGLKTNVASSGTINSIHTDLSLTRGLSGFRLLVVTGQNCGITKDIINNTTGINSIIYTEQFEYPVNSGDTFRLLTPYWFCVNGGTQVDSGTFKVYDYAQDTWTGLNAPPAGSVTNAAISSVSPYWNDRKYTYTSGVIASGNNNLVYLSGINYFAPYSFLYNISGEYHNHLFITTNSGIYKESIITSNLMRSYPYFFSGVLTTNGSGYNNGDLYYVQSNPNSLYYTSSNRIYRYTINQNSWEALPLQTSDNVSYTNLGNMVFIPRSRLYPESDYKYPYVINSNFTYVNYVKLNILLYESTNQEIYSLNTIGFSRPYFTNTLGNSERFIFNNPIIFYDHLKNVVLIMNPYKSFNIITHNFDYMDWFGEVDNYDNSDPYTYNTPSPVLYPHAGFGMNFDYSHVRNKAYFIIYNGDSSYLHILNNDRNFRIKNNFRTEVKGVASVLF